MFAHRSQTKTDIFWDINELEIALDHQEMSQDVDERSKFEERISIANQATPPKSWRSRNELALVLSKGILLNGGDHWISLNKKGEYCEMISGEQCLHCNHAYIGDIVQTGRFSSGKVFPCILPDSNFRIQASPRFLSPHVTYSINFVYKFINNNKVERESFKAELLALKYKWHTETEYWTSCVAQRRGEWLSAELYQFTSYQKEHDFRFDILCQLHPVDLSTRMLLIGIEFLPVEYEKDENIEEEDKGDEQPVIDLDADWEKILSNDYADIIKWSKYDRQCTTNKEMYYLLRKGFLINKSGEQWFSVSKSMKNCLMLPASAVLKEGPRTEMEVCIWKKILDMEISTRIKV